jgi:hypothetical protein
LVWICSGKTQIEKKRIKLKKKNHVVNLEFAQNFNFYLMRKVQIRCFWPSILQKKIDEGWERKFNFVFLYRIRGVLDWKISLLIF